MSEGREHKGQCQKSISGSCRVASGGSPFDVDVLAESPLPSPQQGTHFLVAVDLETSVWGGVRLSWGCDGRSRP